MQQAKRLLAIFLVLGLSLPLLSARSVSTSNAKGVDALVPTNSNPKAGTQKRSIMSSVSDDDTYQDFDDSEDEQLPLLSSQPEDSQVKKPLVSPATKAKEQVPAPTKPKAPISPATRAETSVSSTTQLPIPVQVPAPVQAPVQAKPAEKIHELQYQVLGQTKKSLKASKLQARLLLVPILLLLACLAVFYGYKTVGLYGFDTPAMLHYGALAVACTLVFSLTVYLVALPSEMNGWKGFIPLLSVYLLCAFWMSGLVTGASGREMVWYASCVAAGLLPVGMLSRALQFKAISVAEPPRRARNVVGRVFQQILWIASMQLFLWSLLNVWHMATGPQGFSPVPILINFLLTVNAFVVMVDCYKLLFDQDAFEERKPASGIVPGVILPGQTSIGTGAPMTSRGTSSNAETDFDRTYKSFVWTCGTLLVLFFTSTMTFYMGNAAAGQYLVSLCAPYIFLLFATGATSMAISRARNLAAFFLPYKRAENIRKKPKGFMGRLGVWLEPRVEALLERNDPVRIVKWAIVALSAAGFLSLLGMSVPALFARSWSEPGVFNAALALVGSSGFVLSMVFLYKGRTLGIPTRVLGFVANSIVLGLLLCNLALAAIPLPLTTVICLALLYGLSLWAWIGRVRMAVAEDNRSQTLIVSRRPYGFVAFSCIALLSLTTLFIIPIPMAMSVPMLGAMVILYVALCASTYCVVACLASPDPIMTRPYWPLFVHAGATVVLGTLSFYLLAIPAVDAATVTFTTSVFLCSLIPTTLHLLVQLSVRRFLKKGKAMLCPWSYEVRSQKKVDIEIQE